MNKLLTILILFTAISAHAQFGNSRQGEPWNASWITAPNAAGEEAGLYLFRKTVELGAVPDTFKVHLSADNRYKLYVNEQLVSVGPAWGDIKHWNYETVDLASYLRPGQNIIAAKVWNEGSLRAVAQFSWKTAFILQGVDEQSQVINSDETWKCTEDKSYTPLAQRVRGYYAAGAGDLIDMRQQVGDWNTLSFDDSNWKTAKKVFETEARGFGFRQRAGWNLVPSILPSMELSEQRLVEVRKAEGVSVPAGFPARAVPVRIPANTSAKILLDQTMLTNAYLTLVFSGGENSTIRLTYAEGLYDEKGAKGNRDIIEGKSISGRKDSLISNGADRQLFTTLTYRTYRYVELQVNTDATPLTIDDIYGTFTGYPFEMKAKLSSDREELADMFEIGWRTARLCAVDTYMDCPYYERLQYIGDTRIQHFVSFYNSGDDRLAKNALNLMDYSRQPNGHTLSRYPDRQNQVIPTYSLWYVSMLYDYMMYGTDPDFVKGKLLGSRQILNYFITYLDTDGSLKNVPGWNYTDWVPEWRFGTAPMAEDGSSAALDLQMLHALQSAIALEKHVGKPEFVQLYTTLAGQLTHTIKDKYWDASRNLYADTPEKEVFSQHANALAILAGLVDDADKRAMGEQMLADTSLAPASIYFKYYLHLALNEAGLGDDYLDWLDIWRKNMELGLTTWGETSQVETTRSDCHAWGSSPNIEFFRIILGIESAAPNFQSVRIAPHLGSIANIAGEMPHPAGTISVAYVRSGEKLQAAITLPEGIGGTFVWKGKTHELKGGANQLDL
ncbi:alpha-L-rhamnosidase-related protein [Flavilitoribacter nigricans]|uniref:Alpha-rhamnosidase n=1 Tax=Flavilitoribacter nigricans (strain ATCC 23147 / DSM 23189 / NBRC 102662 / NCIMB 1420 / SS-2) TaxID=1122177 RepID=A0A2D0NEN1_FLAN2|nr:alpha-L-rhamnosidase N-terminal domain-containing protein [Flavilitoribacter nigricans]PHN06826.1 alpha-rhamnosidase [Flavilitoribacter nigricans DSM 23189 = NBRC 102662]